MCSLYKLFILTLQVETKILIELLFTVDFTGSEDLVIENSDEQIIETHIGAESAEVVAMVKEQPHSRFMWQCSWHKLQPSKEQLDSHIAKATMNLNAMTDRSKKVFFSFPLAESDLETIEQHLFENTFKNFYDPEFPPC